MMPKIKAGLELIDRINVGLGKRVSLVGLLFIGTVLYEVFARYFFASPTIWSFEMTTFLCGGIYILGGGWVLRENRHVAIEIISLRLSPRGRAILNLVTYGCFFFPLMIVLLWETIDQALWSWSIWEREYVSSWNAPLYPIKTVIPFAIFFLLLQGVATFIRDLYFVIKRERM
jgi:TRAP-type mannitol/chloroaromatic compound transport system permease small subunit